MTAEALPPRPRRRLLTPATGALTAILLVAGGFAGGVQAQKAAQDGGTASAGARAGGMPAGMPGPQAAQQGGQTADAPTRGEVTAKRRGTLYVETSDGTTVKVRAGDGVKITRTAAASTRGVFPGDTVIVQGKAARSGTITASRIVATASSAADAGGLGALLGGGPPQGMPGAAPGGN